MEDIPDKKATGLEYWFYIGEEYNDHKITEEFLRKWENDEEKIWMCVFCGLSDFVVEESGFKYCSKCDEYKGLVPNIDPYI